MSLNPFDCRPLFEIAWDPITGCAEVSEGCKNCFGVMYAPLLQRAGYAPYRAGNEFKIHIKQLYRIRKIGNNIRAVIFPSRMSDVFQPQVPDAFIRELLAIIASQPGQMFGVLSKWAERLLDFEFPNNLIIGVTAETPEHYDRISFLQKTKAKYRAIALTPLINPHPDLWKHLDKINYCQVYEEIGPHGRPWKPQWVREIRFQCDRAGVFLTDMCGHPKCSMEEFIRRCMALQLFDPFPGGLWRVPTSYYPQLMQFISFYESIAPLSNEEIKAKILAKTPEFFEG